MCLVKFYYIMMLFLKGLLLSRNSRVFFLFDILIFLCELLRYSSLLWFRGCFVIIVFFLMSISVCF